CDAWSQYWREAGQCVNETQLIVGGVNAIIGEFPHIATLTSQCCLPVCPETTDDLSGKELIVAGWGWTSFGFTELTRILQKVNVPVVNHLKCQAKWFNSTTPPRGILQDQLCAGANGRDSCRGDGGPLIQKVRNGHL
ncbi:Mannan-binding lectin serine protease 2-like, partial [Homarus americanus]